MNTDNQKASIKTTAGPVYLNLFAFSFPVTAIASICHRISGIILALGMLPLIYLWQISLNSEQGFAVVSQWLANDLVAIAVLLYAASLFYHALAGLKHLVMDMGFGESKQAASIMSWIVLLGALGFAVLLAYLLFIA